jgi:UDP-N-acetylmuramate--alanine ligase
MQGTPGALKGCSVYFLGIGGIGMSALARYFREMGCKVSGYDKTETPLTKKLTQEGITVHYTDTIESIDMQATLVVYTPAIPAQHEGFVFYKNNGYKLHKRSEVLGWITASMFNICVAGTHGKTTTSAMIAHILRDSGYGCNAFLGGVTSNYQTNYWSHKNAVAVAEADEYDRSFLRLQPDIAVLTSMDPDHLDIYGNEKNMQDAVIAFTGKIRKNGVLIHSKGLPRESELQAPVTLSYSIGKNSADYVAEDIRIENGSYRFNVKSKQTTLSNLTLHMGGAHNIANITAAVAVALQVGIEEDKIKKAVESFKGVKRRFEYILRNDAKVFIDDYAHHPQELTALIQGARELYPAKKITVVFQPHLYSRTKDLAAGFSGALDLADEVLLLPIYPARELPMEGVSSRMILEGMQQKATIVEKENLLDAIRQLQTDVLITAGAGDIDALVEPIKKILANA